MINLTKTRSRNQIKRVSTAKASSNTAKKFCSLNNRRKFIAHDNPLKTYHLKHTKEETIVFAQRCRQERLANRTEAELSCEQILISLGIAFEREAIFINGDRFILLDLFLPKMLTAIEIDGASHSKQRRYDAERDSWLQEKHGITTYRFSNKQVLEKETEVRDVLRSLLGFQTNSEVQVK